MDWAEVQASARASLVQRGLEPNAILLDDLLDPEDVARIERAFAHGFTLRADMDRYDVAMVVATGLAAAAYDFLITRIPIDMTYLGKHMQAGSPMTGLIREAFKADNDNWLAKKFKVSYDAIGGLGDPVPGLGGRTHRLQAYGHDPLIGLVIGTLDLMRGGMTAIGADGIIRVNPGTGPSIRNPFTALIWVIMHMLSDAFTKMGVPAPGWSLLQSFHVGSFGEKERTVADLARFMYLKGYDARHFLTMTGSPVLIETVLGLYWNLRLRMDEEFGTAIEREARVAGTSSMKHHPRHQTMALFSHGIAAAANAGKVAVYQGNPLAVNYVQWLAFLRQLTQWTSTRLKATPTQVTIRQAMYNWQVLEEGWGLIDVSSPDFPELHVASALE